jgi:hypothetical protein
MQAKNQPGNIEPFVVANATAEKERWNLRFHN